MVLKVADVLKPYSRIDPDSEARRDIGLNSPQLITTGFLKELRIKLDKILFDTLIAQTEPTGGLIRDFSF